MNNVLEQTNLFATLKGKRIERIIGRVASKVRLTPATALSLKKNIDENKIDTCIAKYNSVYTELRNAIVSVETAAAEQEARDSVLNGSKSQEEEQRNARILEDNTVAAITASDVTKPRLSDLSIEVNKLQGRFGTLGKNYGVNVRERFIPKALSVPRIYSKIYKVILNNSDLYKLADKVVAVDPSADETLEESPVANWRSLFDGVETSKKDDVVVAMDGKANQDEEELEPVLIETKGLSQEELSHRKMMGQLGDELQEVRRLQESSSGIGSPFSAGLFEREESLLSMLSSLSGVDEIAKKKTAPVAPKNNTEFQDLIEHLVGYKEPVSEEEHRAMEEDMQEYYSDPDVSSTIDELRYKDVLYSFNQPDSYKKVMEAERKDNERVAAQSTAVDLLDSDDVEPVKAEVDDTLMSVGALKQAEMLQKANEEHDKLVKDADEQAVLLQKKNERVELVEGARAQARMIQQEEEHREILDGANEQAHMIQQGQELEEIKKGAEEQARMLKTLYDYMEMQDALNKAQEDEREKILAGALEQAQMLQKENERAELIDGALEQAKEIVAKEEHDEILDSAKKEAYRLQATNDYLEIMGSANQQARMLLDENERLELKNGANEQAQMLSDIPKEAGVMEALAAQIVYQSTTDDDDLVVGAQEQARQIQANNERADLLNGAFEQAKSIIAKEERAQLLEDADSQAREIVAKEEQSQLIEGASEQARILFNNSNAEVQNATEVQVVAETQVTTEPQVVSETSAVVEPQVVSAPSSTTLSNDSKPSFEVIDYNDRYGNIVSASKPIKLRQAQISNMSIRLRGMSSNILERRDALNSLKSQLESSDFDFLRYNEDLLQKSKAA